jgi:hypothetical protein
VYPWIYTGGIDPFLWRPIPGVQTLELVPYRVDLTPFAGVLADGQAHTIALSVFGANDHFSTTAALLVYVDHRAARVTGAVTSNTLVASPVPVVDEQLTTAPDGTITGTVGVRSSHSFTIAGFVETSHGRVRTEVTQRIDFDNEQRFDVSATTYAQDITQWTGVSSHTRTRGRGARRDTFATLEWPLRVTLSATANADQSSEQTTTIRQQYTSTEIVDEGDGAPYARVVSNVVAPSDTLLFDASGAFVGKRGQASSQEYSAFDSRGACYLRKLTAADGMVTADDGGACGTP